MKIWIDGDACPKVIKEILFRAATKRKVEMLIVANHLIATPPSVFIKRVMVEMGFDSADHYIVEHLLEHDLVITSDVILADRVISKKAMALNPKGILYTESNIKQSLSIRNLNESLRSNGIMTGGPSALNPKDVQSFSNHLDKLITRYHQFYG